MLQQYVATITTDPSSGGATVVLGTMIRGKIIGFKYTPGTILTGATLVISSITVGNPQNNGQAIVTGQPILTKASAGTSNVWYYPKAPCNKVADGSASTISEQDIWLMQEAVQVVVSSGGNSKVGSIMMLVDEPVVG